VLLDEIVDGYFDLLDDGEDKLEALEEMLFQEPPPPEREIQQELVESRKRLIAFRRAALPLREVLHQLQDRDVDWIDEENGRNFGIAFDHLLRVLDLLDAQRELLASVVDAQLAIVSNRMNSVMKKMTSWGAILLGSALVAGIYGMNFVHMPELKWKYGYVYALGLMAAIALAGYWYFKRKEWL
jgi:magnesium transporter